MQTIWSLCRGTMEELRENFDEWREAFESKEMRVSLGKTKVMVSEMEEETFDRKIDPCSVCGTRVMCNSVLCTACGKWVHARCTVKRKVAVCLNKNFVCKKCISMVKTSRDQMKNCVMVWKLQASSPIQVTD